MPTTAIATAAPMSRYSVLALTSGASPPATRRVASPTTGSSQRASAPSRCVNTCGRFSSPPTALSTPSTASGPVMIHGASRRCGRSGSPVRFGPWKV